MRKKIFIAVFLSCVITAVTVAAAFGIMEGRWISEHTEDIVILAAELLALILVFGLVSAKIITDPIKNISIERPETKNVYPELKPLVNRLKLQKAKTSRYMNKLSDSREHLSMILESISEGLIVADSKTTVISCNSAAYRLLGAEKLSEGQSIYALSNSDTFRRCVQDAMGGRRAELVVKTENGDRKVIAGPAVIPGTLNGIVVFVLDAAEEQELEQMRREFTSNVSHELKTPLTAIYGISDMLANGIVKSDDVGQFGENIRNEAERLMHLIEDIVALSKLDEDAVPRQNEDVDLYALSEEIIKRLEPSIAKKNITARLTGENVIYCGNRVILDEIVYNLCDNAIKYNKEGGKFTVRISQVSSKAIITVTDTGIGIPREHIERIFERFYRVDKSRSRKTNGTGLGLSIVKHGVSYHNGTVRAVSSGHGAVFVVELPFAEGVQNK